MSDSHCLLNFLFVHLSVLCLNVCGHPFVPPEIKANHDFTYNQSDTSFATSWPLKSGFPGLTVENLNDYLSQFPHCLIAVYNYQGIEIKEWTVPIYLLRFDTVVVLGKTRRVSPYFVPFEKLSSMHNISHESVQKAGFKWFFSVFDWRQNCYAQFDLFYPEKFDAFHFYFWNSNLLPLGRGQYRGKSKSIIEKYT